ncbi:hypothetical protein BMS3Abin03_02618 [bacterium BMS3Abin03]|nr:hypothetical protein BMS3Abin03_02618 [bacterium BMS3Abin03]
MNTKRKLQIEQLDKKFTILKKCSEVITPSKGWLFAIRNTLNMSLKQFGRKLNITAQSAKEIEEREQTKRITLKNLSEAAEALDMQLIYFLIPKNESLEKTIEKRAREVGREIVLRTSHSMSLENQENLPERIEKAIEDKAEQLKNEIPRFLWD